MFLQPGLHALPEQRAVRQHYCGAASRLQKANDEGKEQIGRLACAEMLREVDFNAVLLAPTKRRIGEHDVHAVALGIADVWPRQRVVVAYKARVLDAVQQHIRDAKHVRKLFFLNRPQGRLHLRFVFRPLHIAVTHVAQCAGQKAASAASRVEQDFSGPAGQCGRP